MRNIFIIAIVAATMVCGSASAVLSQPNEVVDGNNKHHEVAAIPHKETSSKSLKSSEGKDNKGNLSLQEQKMKKTLEILHSYDELVDSMPDNVKRELGHYNTFVINSNKKKRELFQALSEDAKNFIRQERLRKKNVISVLGNSRRMSYHSSEPKESSDSKDTKAAIEQNTVDVVPSKEKIKYLVSEVEKYGKLIRDLPESVKLEIEHYKQAIAEINKGNTEYYKSLTKQSKDILKEQSFHENRLMNSIGSGTKSKNR